MHLVVRDQSGIRAVLITNPRALVVDHEVVVYIEAGEVGGVDAPSVAP